MTLEELIKEIKKAGPVAVPVSLGYNELEVIVSKQDLILELQGTQSDEYQIFKKLLPNNVAPYFNIDPSSKYCRNNGYHATPEEHESYFQNLVDFIGKIK